MSRRSFTPSAMVAVALVLSLLAACSPATGGPPAPSTAPSASAEPPQDPLDCETAGYPCSLGEVEPAVVDRSRALAGEATERLADGESVASTATWLEGLDDVAVVEHDDATIRFRLDGGRFTWVLSEAPGSASTSARASVSGDRTERPAPAAPRLIEVGDEASADPRAVVGTLSPQKSALVLSPFGFWDQFKGGANIATDLRAIRGYEDSVQLVQITDTVTDEVTADTFKSFDSFDVVYVHTWAAKVCPLPRECHGALAAFHFDDPDFHLAPDETAFMDIIVWKGADGAVEDVLGLEPDFFRHFYPERIRDALIVLDAGGGDDRFGRAMMAASSRFYFWRGTPDRRKGTNALRGFIRALGDTGRPADAVFQEMQDQLVDGQAKVDGLISASMLGLRDLRIREVVTVRNPAGDALNDREVIGFEGVPEDSAPDVVRLAIDVEGVNPGEAGARLDVTVGDAEPMSFVLADDGRQMSDYVWRVDVEVEHPDLQRGQELAISVQAPLPDGGASWQELTVVVDGDPAPEIGKVYRGTATTTIHSADGLAATYTADVTLTRNPDQDPDARMLEFMVTEGTFHWSVEGATLNGCTASAPAVDVPMPVETEFPALTIVRPKEPGQPITYLGSGELNDGPAVEVSLDCPNLGDTTFTDHADGVWFYAPREQAFELTTDTISGTYRYGEELVREFQWSFSKVE